MSKYRQIKARRLKINNPDYQWLEKNYPGFLHTIFMQGLQAGVYESRKLYPFAYKYGCSINSSNQKGELEIDWFWDARELKRVRNLFLNKSRRNLDFFLKVYRRWEKDLQANLKAYGPAEKINFRKLTDRELYDCYERLYQLNIRQGATGYLADCFLSSGEQDWLTDFIRQQAGEKQNLAETVRILTAPVRASYTNEEEIALAKITRRISIKERSLAAFLKRLKNNKKLWQLVESHRQKFYWIENNYFDRPLAAEYFAKKIFLEKQSKKKFAETLRILKDNRIQKQRLLKKLNIRWLANVISMASMFTHMQDYRKMAFIRLSHYFRLIFEEMAVRTGLKLVDFYNLVEPEFEQAFLHRNFDRQKLKQRFVKNFCYGTAKGYLVYEGRELKRYLKESDFFPPILPKSIIKGVPAAPGKVRGQVRIVKDAHKSLFKKGEILVTNNTTPEFVPLMKLAAAIVTEQGGITTHAAIVSRELGVPCVIGTRIATKALKDGDWVEVDANNGIIKRL